MDEFRKRTGTSTPRGREGRWIKAWTQALQTTPVLHRFETCTMGEIWGETFHETFAHELIHVRHGHAEVKFRRRGFRVGPGDTFTIPKGTPHKDVPSPEQPYQVFLIFFHWPGADELIKLLSGSLADEQASARTHLHWLFGELERECLSDGAESLARANLVLLECLLAHVRMTMPSSAAGRTAVRESAARKRKRLATGAEAYLREHFTEPINLEDMAAAFNVSSFHLSRTYSREFGHSISDAVSMIRIERAKDLLATRELSVKEIAAAVGYANGNYFAKVFRRIAGVSPSEYQVMVTDEDGDHSTLLGDP